MTQPPIRPAEGAVFRGHSRADVKRKAVRWWSRHAAGAVSLRQFLAGCRMAPSERIIVYAPARSAAA